MKYLTILITIATLQFASAQTPTPTPTATPTTGTVSIAWDAPVDPFLYRVQPIPSPSPAQFQAQYKTPNISDFVPLDTKLYATQPLAQAVIDNYKSVSQGTKYNVYEHIGANYVNIASVNMPTTTYTTTNVTPGYHTYVVRTANNIGLESAPTNEVTTGQIAPPSGLRITSQTINAQAQRVTVSWRTSSPSTGKIYYGRDVAHMENFIRDLKLTTDHSVRITGLKKKKHYVYQIIANGGAAGNTTSEVATLQ